MAQFIITIIGCLVIIACAILIGGYYCLFGGIAQIIDVAQMQPIDGAAMALGIVRVLLGLFTIPVTFWVCFTWTGFVSAIAE